MVFMDFGVELRCATDALNTGIDATEKFLSQAVPPILVPVVRLTDILLGFWGENEFSGHDDS